MEIVTTPPDIPAALQSIFTDLVLRYTPHTAMPHELWQELLAGYTQPNRHYHNLNHIAAVLAALMPVQANVKDWDALLFSVFYHDVVYDVAQTDNEAQSAELALSRLSEMGFPAERTAHCYQHILATQRHEPSTDADTNLFTDADLSILGQPAKDYETYTQQIRQEYSMYPDSLYLPGRAKVLMHFLAMPHIFKTDYFQHQYETQAKTNLSAELALLSSGS